MMTMTVLGKLDKDDVVVQHLLHKKHGKLKLDES